MRVLTWNLFHGRADPPAGRPLLHEFAATLAGWSWDVALLQEVPPWWPPLLGRACGADVRAAPTSRNAFLPARRAIASRRPDLLRSNGGGANAVLVRSPVVVTGHGVRRLRLLPERRVVHAVRLAVPPDAGGASRSGSGTDGADAVGPGTDGAGVIGTDGGGPGTGGCGGHGAPGELWVGNVHAQKGAWDDGPGLLAPSSDVRAAALQVEAWSRGTASRAEPAPLLLGGDLNLPRDAVAGALPEGWTRIASSGPDHVAGRGLVAADDSSRPGRGTLSDHAALVVDVRSRR